MKSTDLNSKQTINPQGPIGFALVVEDEEEIRELICLHLLRENIKVDSVNSAEAAEEQILKNKYNLFLLDWMLPGASGVSLAQNIRRKAIFEDASILMLTARTETNDIVAGLEAGADDYLTKPFEPSVLRARVRALLRRNRRFERGINEKSKELKNIKIGDLEMSPDTHKVRCQGEELNLTVSEFKLLYALAESGGRVLTRDSLISQVQGEGVSVVGRTVDTHVFGLRKKLGLCMDVIETVRGIGYRVKPPGETEL